MPTYEVNEMGDSGSGSRGGGNSSELLIFDVEGFADGDGEPNVAGARAAVLADSRCPDIYAGLYRGSVRHKCRGGARWLIDVEYGQRARDPEKIGIRWGIRTTNQKRLVSIQTIARYGGSLDHRGAINVSRDKVNGCDVPVPEGSFGLTFWRKPADLPIDFFLTAFALAGKVNDDTFYGFPAGTLLFNGSDSSFTYDVTGDPDEQELVAVPLDFSFSPNVTGLTIQGISGIAKKGWEYLWPSFDDVADLTYQKMIMVPNQINREKVVEEASFCDLGFGTDFP